MDKHTWLLRWDRFRYWLLGAEGGGGIFRRIDARIRPGRYEHGFIAVPLDDEQLERGLPSPVVYFPDEQEREERPQPRHLARHDPRVTVLGRARRGRRR